MAQYLLIFIFAHAIHSIIGQCPPPENKPHMIYIPKPAYEEGSKVIYKCDYGYVKDEGDGTAVCQRIQPYRHYYSWTQPTLKCIPTMCPPPPDVENGRIIGTDFRFARTISYECNEGYRMKNHGNGNAELVCIDEGKWNGDVPTCKPVRCERLPPVNFGIKSSTSTLFNTTVVYSCNQGFVLKGPKEIYCKPDGIWSDKQPTCEDIECVNPDSKSFKENHKDLVSIIDYGLGVGHTIVFKCNGDDIEYHSECNKRGEWIPPPPDCSKGTSSIDVGIFPITQSCCCSIALLLWLMFRVEGF